MTFYPIRHVHMRAEPFLDDLRMLLQIFLADHKHGRGEFPVWPESAFIQKDPTLAFYDQPSGPGFRRPGCIQLLLDKHRPLIRIGHATVLASAALCPSR